ncbi:MAG: DUF4830 domain-containing protein [Eubacteriales bacterium]|nr:DUF4830 domain-containing protein [Eubacteriales bacterium]
MLKKSTRFNRKKALLIIGCFALLFLLGILAKGLVGSRSKPDLNTAEGRTAYLRSYGWEADVKSEAEKRITFPSEFGDVMTEYCQLQRSQGFELEKYSGKECMQYTYRLMNYTGGAKDVFITIYVYKGNVIAGDIHTLSSDGFMHGFISQPRL